jgi:hypothetical protein
MRSTAPPNDMRGSDRRRQRLRVGSAADHANARATSGRLLEETRNRPPRALTAPELVREAARWTTPVQTAAFGLLLRHVLSAAAIVVSVDVDWPKPGQLVLMTADVDRARRSPLASPGAPHGPYGGSPYPPVCSSRPRKAVRLAVSHWIASPRFARLRARRCSGRSPDDCGMRRIGAPPPVESTCSERPLLTAVKLTA